MTDKLTTMLELINRFSFAYAVDVCDSSLRPFDWNNQVNVFTPPDSSPFDQVPVWGPDVPHGPPLSLDQLRAAAALLPTHAARQRTLAVTNFASGLSGSAGESISRVRMLQLGFPTPVLQKSFVLSNGRNAPVDFWFDKQKVAGEFDGLGKYLWSGWGGGLSTADRIIAEKKREDQIRAQGVSFVRWGWTEMQNTAQLARLLRRAGLPRAHKSAAV